MASSNTVNSVLNRMFPFPDQLRPKRGTREFRRVRAIAAMLIMVTATSVFWTAVLTMLCFVFHFDLLPNVIIGIGVLVILGLQTWGFYHFANVRLSAIFLSMSYFLMVAILVAATGGYDSELKPLMLSCPVISFRIGGKEEGISNSIFVGILGLMMIFAKYQDFVFTNYLANTNPYFFAMIAWVVTLGVTLTCLMAYDIDE